MLGGGGDMCNMEYMERKKWSYFPKPEPNLLVGKLCSRE
jgi:hypothetical protein